MQRSRWLAVPLPDNCFLPLPDRTPQFANSALPRKANAGTDRAVRRPMDLKLLLTGRSIADSGGLPRVCTTPRRGRGAMFAPEGPVEGLFGFVADIMGDPRYRIGGLLQLRG